MILKRSPLPITGVKKRRRRNINLAPGAEVEAGVVVVAEAEIVNPEEHEVRREEKRKPVTN